MEVKKQSLFQKVYERVQQSFFDIMLDLLREKVTNQLTACFLMFVMFLQIVSQLFDANFFDWNDQFLLDIFKEICDYMRVINAIEKSRNQTYYFILFYFALAYLSVILALFTYHYYALKKPQYYVMMLVKALRLILLIQYWILFMPFFEVFISIFNCNSTDSGTYHYLVKDLQCYQGSHIVYCVLSAIGLLIQLSLNVIIALLYNETQPVKEDSLSRLESTFELLLFIYRIFVCSFTMLCHSSFCGWVLLFVYLASGITLSYQYFIYIPYYNQFVSIFFGSIINIYTWIAVNCLLTKIWIVSGHLIIIMLGCPLIVYIVIYLRQQRIEFLMDNTMEKISSDVDALIQINMIKDLSIGRAGSKVSGDSINSVESEMKIKGIINLHFEECKNDQCICRNLEELYDCSQQQYLTPTHELHNESIFIAHYNKKLFEEAIGKFIGSPGLHISFSFYLFSVMKNVHAALHELNVAQKKKPTIQQQFTIFRYKYIIEHYVKTEELKTKHIYQQLTKVKEFEILFLEMSKAIESVCNCQVEFWSQLTTAIPDLNILNDLGNKIYAAAEKADYYWNELRSINPNYPHALKQYGEYISLIRNNPQIGKQYIDKSANHTVTAVVSDQNFVKKSEILFTIDTTVVHISGNRDTSGKILHVSNGLLKNFGHTKAEVVGHNVSFLMPGIIGSRHNDFLEKFYKSGRQVVFNNERPVFALNKQGFCFYAKVLVKQMPSLKEGIQYVGMIRPTYTEFDYIITSLNGNIDSFSRGVKNLIGIEPEKMKAMPNINIMMLCPELIDLFEQRRKLTKANVIPVRRINSEMSTEYDIQDVAQQNDPDQPFATSKLAQPGGSTLALIVPKDFEHLTRLEKPQKQQQRTTSNTGLKKKNQQQNQNQDESEDYGHSDVRDRKPSQAFAEFIKYISKARGHRRTPNIRQLLLAKEYKDYDKFKLVQCELEIQESRINRSDLNSLKYLVFKIRHPGNKNNKDIQDFPGQNDQENDNEDAMSQGLDDEQDQLNLMKNASIYIQEVFGPKDDASKNNQQQVFGAFRYQFQKFLAQNLFQGMLGLKPMGGGGNANNGNNGGEKDGNKNFVPRGPWAELVAARDRIQAEKAKQAAAPGGGSTPSARLAIQPAPSPQASQREESKEAGSKVSSNVRFQSTDPQLNKPSEKKVLFQSQQSETKSIKDQDGNGSKSVSFDPKIPILNTKTAAKTLREQQAKTTKEGVLNDESGDKQPNKKFTQKMTYKSSFKTDSEYRALDAEDNEDSKKSDDSLHTAKQSTDGPPVGGAKALLMNIIGASPTPSSASNNNHGSNQLNNSQFQSPQDNQSQPPVPMLALSAIQVPSMNAQQQQKNLDQQETPRIDVKKDISINDKIKKKTATYQEAGQGIPGVTSGGAKNTQLDTINQEPSIASTNKRTASVTGTSQKNNTEKKGKHSTKKSQSGKEDTALGVSSDEDDEKRSKATAGFKAQGTIQKQSNGDENESIVTDADIDEEEELEYEEEDEEDMEEFIEEEIEASVETDPFIEDGDEEGKHETDALLEKTPQQSQQQMHLPIQNPSENYLKVNMMNRSETSAVSSMRRGKTTRPGWDENDINQKKKKIRNYEKIVTNKKDVQYDLESCGSVYFREWDPSQEELNIREIIKKSEKRKQKQERRRQKQVKGDGGAGQRQVLTTGGTADGGASTQDPGQEEDNKADDSRLMEFNEGDGGNESAGGNSNVSGSAKKGAQGGGESKQSLNGAAAAEDDDDISDDGDAHQSSMMQHDDAQGDVSSVASSMYSQMRSYFTLRNSIDEKFVPLSIKNLKTVAAFVFIGLMVLNITQFAIQRSLFQQVNENIQNIHHSEQRISHIIDINLRIQNLRFLNQGLLQNDFFYKVNATEFRQLQNELLLISSTALQDSQTALSLATSSFEEGIRKQINPDNVVLVYDEQPQGEREPVSRQSLQFNIWESVIKIVVNTYQLTTDPLSIVTSNPIVKFIQENCLNSLLGALTQSTQAIIVATDNIRTSSLNLFLYLLIVVSCSLVLSLVFLLPIISRAKQSKQEVLELFLHKKIEKGIDDQLKLCRWFIQRYQVRAETGSVGAGGAEQDAVDEHLQNAANQESQINEQDLKKEKEELYNMKKQKKKKKWRKLNINFGYLSLQLLVIVAILEMFYLINYLMSNTFMSEVNSLTQELRLLISREPLYMLVLLTQKELFYSNGTARILGKSVREILAQYNKQLIEEEQNLLELFSLNYAYHTDTYNTQFNALLYSNICDDQDTLGPYMVAEAAASTPQLVMQLAINKDECEAFNVGILKKGLYSTVTKYLSSLKQIDSQFQLLRKPNETAKDYINDQKVIQSERTCDIYMKKVHDHLVMILEEDINHFFSQEYSQDTAIFIVFFAYLFFIYFFVWRIFVSNLLDELWKAKSMLSVLPIDMCFKIEEIRLFIYANSSSSKVK